MRIEVVDIVAVLFAVDAVFLVVGWSVSWSVSQLVSQLVNQLVNQLVSQCCFVPISPPRSFGQLTNTNTNTNTRSLTLICSRTKANYVI